ncbi:MAG: sigma-54 dependent transcriptional regulator [Gammaproteobacteria bacterium]|nr:sigma-54 dependent transcriptional regulator [Gammaproteobacteria bacterium]
MANSMQAEPGSHTDPSSRPANSRPNLLLVDDDPLIAESLAFVLRERFTVHIATTRPEALAAARALEPWPTLALVDLGLPPTPHDPAEGFAVIDELLAGNPSMKILVLSGQSELANIQHALSLGAVDFIPKPCEPALLTARLTHQLKIIEAEDEQPKSTAVEDDPLIGESAPMRALRDEIDRYADTPFPVLIEGESGTGKELVAAMLHRRCDRASEPFLTVNCAAFTPELLEAQLFGHAKGAFTGATQARSGFFEDAGKGTLFLDEIGEFPLALQPKLLRVLENGDFYRVGETHARTSQARIIAATNRDLMLETRERRFRQDLYHRLGVLTLKVPPLRNRDADALALFEHFQHMYAATMSPFTLDDAARERWLSYSFPGNVRELRNIVIRLGAKYPGQAIGLAQLELELDQRSDVDAQTIERLVDGRFSLDEMLGGWEQRYINAALRLSNGNLSEAARLLGVNRTTLYSRIQRLGTKLD